MTSRAEDLSSAERESLQSLLFEFGRVISLGGGDLGCTDVVKHHIDTGNAEPIRQRARKLPFHKRGETQHLADQMLSRNIIEPAQGPWASPVVLVKKKDGSTRFCVDFRKVNQVTKKDAQPLPRIDDTLDALGTAQLFSTLDLANTGRWKLNQMTGRRPPLPPHMDCISSVSCHSGFATPLEHSNDSWNVS